MRQLTIALAPMGPILDDVSRNLDTMVQLVEDIIRQRKVDLVVFPELVTTGSNAAALCRPGRAGE